MLEKEIINANKQCNRIKNYIKEHEDMFNAMDLKLHDASYYEYKDMENDFPLCYADNKEPIESSYFYMFCDSTYNQFINWCEEQNIDFRAMCHSIGRTSSFYLYEKELVQRENGKINWSWTMYNIFYLGYSNILEFDNEGNIDIEESFRCNGDYYTKEEWNKKLKSALQYITDEMYNDFMKEIEDVKKVYEYIKDTKDNQIEYFKEWLEMYEEDLQCEKDKKEKEIAKRKEIISKMPERIRPIMYRSALDSDDLSLVLTCMTKKGETI